MPDSEWDSIHRSIYESTAFSDVHWIKTAANLVASAKLLEPEVLRMWEGLRARARDSSARVPRDHYQGVYFMLMAFAVENLFKAAIVRRNSIALREAFNRTGQLPRSLHSHDLVVLASKAGLTTSLEEEDFLRRLTRSAVWYGRYPVPLKYEAISGSERFSDGQDYSVSWSGGRDIEGLTQLVRRIKSALELRD